jgi:GT2 family glycosyltransferase
VVVLVIVTSLRLASTLGVTYALRVGINYAIKYGPDWLLLLDDDTVLKMNCESCEYDIILNDYEHVRLFKELIFEYHSYATNRSVTELINTMGREFNCQL